MKYIFSFLLFFVGFHVTFLGQCNGDESLCVKRYNEVSVVMTHNAFCCGDKDYTLPNQQHCITQQLQEGVRGLMIDVYNSDGNIVVYHAVEAWGSEPLADILNEIKTFMYANPNEVISIIFQSDVTATDIGNELDSVGLMPYLYHHEAGAAWATLQEMIDDNKRLVVFSESDDGLPEQTWYHYAWGTIFDTDYSYDAPSDFHCGVNRGSADNDLYLVNHWVSSGLGTGDSTQAIVVNENPLLLDRLRECMNEHGKLPNFVGVDYYNFGSVFAAVDSLNDNYIVTTPINVPFDNFEVSIYPNPVQDFLSIEHKGFNRLLLTFWDVQGQIVLEEKIYDARKKINCGCWLPGVYFYSLSDVQGKIVSSGKVQKF